MCVKVNGVGGLGGGGVGRGSDVCLCGGAVGQRVCWARCWPVRCAVVRARLRMGLCCCRLAGCRPWTVRRRDGWCKGLWASCGARGRFLLWVCGAGGLFGLGAHRPRIRGAGYGSAPGRRCPVSLDPCGRVVLWWLSLRCPFGRTLFWGLCGVPALDGAGSPVVRVASVARCCCGVATGAGGVEVDGLGDVEDVAADVRARTLVALVAVVARDQGGLVVMVAVLREE